MARPTLNLSISLDNIHCYDEGDGWGNAEPYLWAAFFKIDGDSFSVPDAATGLTGTPVIVSTNGDHGNLGDTDVDAGDDVPIPPAIGLFESQLKPIPILDETVRELLGEDDLPGFAGVAVALMEQDSWPDSLARTGYEAFVSAVQQAVASVAASFQHATHAPTKEEMDAAIQQVKDTASSQVESAVKDAMSTWQQIWYGTVGNNDDTIGSEVFNADIDDFTADAFIAIVKRWDNEGDWQISGMMSGVSPCPATALAGFFDVQTVKGSLEAMEKFRRERFRSYPGLNRWWQALSANTNATVKALRADARARAELGRLLVGVPAILSEPDKPLAAEHIQAATTVLETLGRENAAVNRAFARRALTIVGELRGKTWNEAVERIADTPPLGRRRPDYDPSGRGQ
jgi:hypothetical protein